MIFQKIIQLSMTFKATQKLVFFALLLKNNGLKTIDALFGNKKVLLISQETDDRYQLLTQVKELDGVKFVYLFLNKEFFENLYSFYMQNFRKAKPAHARDVYKDENCPKFKKALTDYEENIDRLLSSINFFIRPLGFVTASFGDARWKRFSKIVMSKYPFLWIVTEREGALVPRVRKVALNRVRKAYEPRCDLLTTSNQVHGDYWRKAIDYYESSDRKSSVVVTGELKSDFWYLKNEYENLKESLNSKVILYFVIAKKSYLKPIIFPELSEDENWNELQNQTILGLKEIVNQRDDVKIVIKSRGVASLEKEIIDLLKDEIANGKVILIGKDKNAIELLKVADVVCGVQSTALIESQMIKKPVLYCGWGALHDKVYPDLFPFKEADMVHCRSQNELVEKLHLALENMIEIDLKKRKDFFSLYFEISDGKVHQNVLEQIIKIARDRKLI